MVIALADLAEAEGRLLRRNAARLGGSLALVLVSLLLAGAGAGLMLWALYLALSAALGAPLGALLTGLAALGVAGVGLWIASRLAR